MDFSGFDQSIWIIQVDKLHTHTKGLVIFIYIKVAQENNSNIQWYCTIMPIYFMFKPP